MAALWLCGSCVQIDGGAIELSWAVRDFDGNSRSCGETGISAVSLCWQPSDGLSDQFVCQATASSTFPCDRERGSTAFEVPPGPTALWIQVGCGEMGEAADPDTYEVPAPIVRTVRDGEVVTLNSLLIIATPACGTEACTCPLP